VNLKSGLLHILAIAFLPSTSFAATAAPGAAHQNFQVAVYIPVQIVEHMKDRQCLAPPSAPVLP